jgi:hypothetical protein
MSVPNIPIEDLKTAIANSLSSVFRTMLSYDCESQRHEDLTGSRAHPQSSARLIPSGIAF